MSTLTDWITAISAAVSAGGVVFAVRQLHLTKQISQQQFEDRLAEEYRDLASRIPTKALLGSGLSPTEYQAAFDELFRYIDLSNEQVMLRKHKRISPEVWASWCSGIEFNLALPAFQRAWVEIQKKNPTQFSELKELLKQLDMKQLQVDPAQWDK